MTVTRTIIGVRYKGWLMTKHHQWHEENTASWSESSLDVTSFLPLTEFHGGVKLEKNVPLESLAVSVRRMPEGGDALDLTRIVQYSKDNSTEYWLYPHNYEKLLDLLGCPLTVRDDNHDRVTFERWNDTKPLPPQTWSTEEQKHALQALESKYMKKKVGNIRFDAPVSDMLSGEPAPIAAA
jgi:hypothetical protein